MKVGVYLVNRTPISEGGAFSYMERLLEGIDNYNFGDSLEVCFVGRISPEQITFKKRYCKLTPFFLYKFFRVLEEFGIVRFFSKLYIDIDLRNKIDRRRLSKEGIDVLFYPKQMFCDIKDFPFISMNWDLGHITSPAFPEFVLNRNYEVRKRWYDYEIGQALAVFAESESGKKELITHTDLSESKVFVVPMFSGKVVDLQIGEREQLAILSKFNLRGGTYFFYPAQFWAHKNHYNLLVAFNELVKDTRDSNVKIVFTGSNQGNKNYIQSVIDRYGLGQQVLMLGFVSNEELFTLYVNSIALVMPTFLGPTNMPLLEAQALKVPVVCSDFEGHREMCRDGALYVDPADTTSIKEAMVKVMNPGERQLLLLKAGEVVKESPFKIDTAVKAIGRGLNKIKTVRLNF